MPVSVVVVVVVVVGRVLLIVNDKIDGWQRDMSNRIEARVRFSFFSYHRCFDRDYDDIFFRFNLENNRSTERTRSLKKLTM